MRKLHIGGEQKKEGWEIFNITPAPYVDYIGNAKNLSCFKDETFDEIYASHILEHFDYQKDVSIALNEWYRVLKSGGKIYISVPDMQAVCKLFLKTKDALKRIQLMRILLGGHCNQDDYHYSGFDFDILNLFLQKAGFVNTRRLYGFGVFEDTSNLVIADTLISLNIIAEKES